jgi:hypothetical protein
MFSGFALDVVTASFDPWDLRSKTTFTADFKLRVNDGK